jgi:anaerobic selenocysteine-containing dehydrogenase
MMHVILAEKLQDDDYINRYTTGIAALREKAGRDPPERVSALTGIPATGIAALAREYATTRPALIRANYGLQRSERGGAASMAVSMLPALIGAWRDPGGGMLYSTSGAFHLDRAALERADLQQESLGRPARLLNMSSLARVLHETNDPPIKAMVVHSSNPAAVVPDQDRVVRGLAREDLFLVVLEQFLTDTAAYADFVLPSTTFLEHDDLYFAYGHHHLQLARKAVEPPGECRPNAEVFRALAMRMGFDDPCFEDSTEDMIRQALASGHGFLDEITFERLEREHSVRLNVSAPGTPFLPHAEGFPALGGKMDFQADLLDYTPPVESRLGDPSLRSAYPLELVSPKHPEGMNSTFGNRSDADHLTASVSINAADAAPRGIANGDLVRVFNGRGAIRLRAEVNGAVHPGVVSAPSCRWPGRSPDGRNSNAIISDRLTDFGGSPAFYSCLVQVEKCGD